MVCGFLIRDVSDRSLVFRLLFFEFSTCDVVLKSRIALEAVENCALNVSTHCGVIL
jgi:hypothetical protein